MPSEQIHDIAAFAGYLNDDRELLTCTSGGIATALARAMLLAGGHVAGVSYAEDFYSARYEIISRLEDLDRLKGSKYVQPRMGSVYADVKALLEQEQKVLFFGLPCTVAAVKRYLGKEYDRLITVELACHGPTTEAVHQQYLQHLEKTYGSKIVGFCVRKKKDTWTPAYLYARFENGQTFWEEFYRTEYGYGFSMLLPPGCYRCQFRGDNRVADLLIGDFWGANQEDPFWNRRGVSAILVHSQKGLDFLQSIREISLFETTAQRITQKNKSILHAPVEHPKRQLFAKLLAEKGLLYAVKHTKPAKQRARDFCKSLLPRRFVAYLRKHVKHKLRNK